MVTYPAFHVVVGPGTGRAVPEPGPAVTRRQPSRSHKSGTRPFQLQPHL